MIVVSGALVIVAIILLVAGLFSDGLPLIYASIAVSIASGILLLVGVFQRKPSSTRLGEEGAATPITPAEVEPATLVTPTATGATSEPLRAAATVAEAEPNSVFVVSGRPRYHSATCRFLEGRDDADAISRDEAVSAGFTACGVCRPDGAAPTAVPNAPAAAADSVAAATATAAKAAKAPAKATLASSPASMAPTRTTAAAKAAKAPTKAVMSPAKAPASATKAASQAAVTPVKGSMTPVKGAMTPVEGAMTPVKGAGAPAAKAPAKAAVRTPAKATKAPAPAAKAATKAATKAPTKRS